MQTIYNYPLQDKNKKFIHSIWIVKNGMEGTRQTSALLVPMGYPYIHIKGGKPNEINYQGEIYRHNAFLAGQTTVATKFEFPLDMDAIFIRLKPWSLPKLTGTSADYFAEKYWSLKDVNELLMNNLLSVLEDDLSPEEKGAKVEQFLLLQLNEYQPDQRALTAIDLIKSHYGMIKMNELADLASVSLRRLQQLFLYNMGISPKKIANIYRLHKITYDVVRNQYPISAYDYHYDQAHFINDFKKMTFMSLTDFKDLVFTNEEKKAVLRVNLYFD